MKLARGGDFFLNEGTRPAQGTIARSGTFSIDRIGLNGFLPGFSAGNMKAHEGQRGRAGDGKGGGGGEGSRGGEGGWQKSPLKSVATKANSLNSINSSIHCSGIVGIVGNIFQLHIKVLMSFLACPFGM